MLDDLSNEEWVKIRVNDQELLDDWATVIRTKLVGGYQGFTDWYVKLVPKEIARRGLIPTFPDDEAMGGAPVDPSTST
jgi:hypothetical protein